MKKNFYSNTSCKNLLMVTVNVLGIMAVFSFVLQMPKAFAEAGLQKVNEAIYRSAGTSNVYLAVTSAGNVLIDTGTPFEAAMHKKRLSQVSDAKTNMIILTHGHQDHISGVDLWKESHTRILAHQDFFAFRNYMVRLSGFFARRTAAQFGLPYEMIKPKDENPGNYAAHITPEISFGETLSLEIGNLTFNFLHTPGETPDMIAIWIPKYKALFIGDNYYDAFPNLYTLRGTMPRYALDYVNSINKVLAFEPEILLPGHGEVILGREKIKQHLIEYRNAILYVHDATVTGMNQGKDVFTLMNDIELPSSYNLKESYGRVSWAVRAIYEGYAGWFDEKPLTMYSTPVSSIFDDLVELTGGSTVLLERARKHWGKDEPLKALWLIEIAAHSDKHNQDVLKIKLEVLSDLRSKSTNSNEIGWLNTAIKSLEKSITPLKNIEGK